MKILIADDHKIIRDGLRSLIDKQPGMEVVADLAFKSDIDDAGIDGLVVIGGDGQLQHLVHRHHGSPLHHY